MRCLRTVACTLVVTMVLLLTACSFVPAETTDSTAPEAADSAPNEIGTTGIFVYTDTIKVDLEYGSETLGFPLNFVTDRPLEENTIQLIRLEGKSVDYFSETVLTRRQIENVTDVEIDGRYLYTYNVDSVIDIDYFTKWPEIDAPEVWEICIDAVVVEIEGNEYRIDLQYPVRYHYNDKGYNDISGIRFYGPIMVFSYAISEQYSANIYNNASDIFVTDAYFVNYLEMRDKVLYYQTEYQGELTGDVSYLVPKRESGTEAGTAGCATLCFTPEVLDQSASSEFDYFLCTMVITYKVAGDDTVYKMRFPFNSQGIGNRETAENYLNYLKNKETTN